MLKTPRQSVLILGLGLSGCAAAELAIHNGHSVHVLDESDTPPRGERVAGLRERGVNFHLGWHEDNWNAAVDLVIISPGIAADSTLGRIADSLGCPVISELEYGFRHCSCPVLAVTGTNGKSTTVELITHCLRTAGYAAVAAGNIGIPLCDIASKRGDLDFIVVEVSSFQLERTDQFAPLAAALLNLTPDHLDRYPDATAYYQAKMRLFKNMVRSDKIILRHDLAEMPLVRQALPARGKRPLTFTAAPGVVADFFVRPDGALCHNWQGQEKVIVEQRKLRLRGRHNLENVLAAAAICDSAGVAGEKIVGGLCSFAPSPHRMELVAVANGVQYINDSKATNPDSMARAIQAVAEDCNGKILLLAGGLDKGVVFESVKPLLRQHVKEVFLIGKCRNQLAAQWKDAVSCKVFASLAAATEAALESAETGDTVLLSPGCASQDMFRDYADRGNAFSDIIKRSVGE